MAKKVINIGEFTWRRQLRKPESHYSGNETALMMHYDWALNFHREPFHRVAEAKLVIVAGMQLFGVRITHLDGTCTQDCIFLGKGIVDITNGEPPSSWGLWPDWWHTIKVCPFCAKEANTSHRGTHCYILATPVATVDDDATPDGIAPNFHYEFIPRYTCITCLDNALDRNEEMPVIVYNTLFRKIRGGQPVGEEQVELHPTGKKALTSLRQLRPSHPFIDSVGPPIPLNNSGGNPAQSAIYPASDLLLGLANAGVFQPMNNEMSEAMFQFHGMGHTHVAKKKTTVAADGTIKTENVLKFYTCDWCEKKLEKTDPDSDEMTCGHCTRCGKTRY